MRSYVVVVGLVLGTGGCAANAPPAESTVAADDGRAILERTCTVCHDLGGLPAFAEYWGEPEWRSLVDTMISYGASLTPAEYEILGAYLAEAY